MSAETTQRQFVDTNVLVYSRDATAGRKQARAAALIADLWESGHGCLSLQVLQELFVTLTRKVPRRMEAEPTGRLVSDLLHWRVHCPGPQDLLAAIDLHRRDQVSFWDAMILRSAEQLGCDLIWSEDLNPGQIYTGVKVKNPFVDD